MGILIVSGGFHEVISSYLAEKLDLIDSGPLTLQNFMEYLQQYAPAVNGVIVTDAAASGQQEGDRDRLSQGLHWLSTHRGAGIPVFYLTRNPLRPALLEHLTQKNEGFRILLYDEVRLPLHVYQTVIQGFTEKKRTLPTPQRTAEEPRRAPQQEATAKSERKNFFGRFFSKSAGETDHGGVDPLSKQLSNISRGMSRIVAVTGHRGSGLTSTAFNLAHEASKRGLSTMIIDMDTEYRSMNMYFDRFHEQSHKYEEIGASLIRTLARPQDYMTTACSIKDNLWLTSLGYSFRDRKLMEQFYTNDKLVGLLSLLRTRFNLVLLDMPLDLFHSFRETMIHIDVFGLCVPNNLHAVLSTLRNVEVVMDAEKASYLNAKSKLIVTKYNDRSRFQESWFTPEKVGEVLTGGLSDIFRYEIGLAGHVPYSSTFDTQIETDMALTNLAPEYGQAFGNILLRLMEGA